MRDLVTFAAFIVFLLSSERITIIPSISIAWVVKLLEIGLSRETCPHGIQFYGTMGGQFVDENREEAQVSPVKNDCIIPQRVSPDTLFITDIDSIEPYPSYISIIPTYYQCTIDLTPKVVVAILKVAIRQSWLVLKGTITYVIANKKEYYNGKTS